MEAFFVVLCLFFVHFVYLLLFHSSFFSHVPCLLLSTISLFSPLLTTPSSLSPPSLYAIIFTHTSFERHRGLTSTYLTRMPGINDSVMLPNSNTHSGDNPNLMIINFILLELCRFYTCHQGLEIHPC